MISYKPFWKMLKERGISTYQLIYHFGILPDTVQRLRSGKAVTTTTLNMLCVTLGCDISDILAFEPEEE